MIDFKKYSEFVDAVTSKETVNFSEFIARLFEINEYNVVGNTKFDIQRLLTAAVGMSAESGEFTEIIKKIVFQGKPVNDENIFHLKREMGDIMWYFIQACLALDVTPEEIIEMNVDKLKSRYPGGDFDVHYSENRKEGDL